MLPYKREFYNPDELYLSCKIGEIKVLSQQPTEKTVLENKNDLTFNPNNESYRIPVVCISENDPYLIEYFTEEEKFKMLRGGNSVETYFRDNYQLVNKKADELEKQDVQKKPRMYYLNEALYELPVKHIKHMKISTAAGLYKYFNSKCVFDPNFEFGSRMIGASLAGVEVYHALNPLGYKTFPKQIEAFCKKPNYFVNADNLTVTDSNLVSSFSYDTVLTELLFMEQFERTEKFTDANDWLIKDAYPFISACSTVLVLGGHLVLYFRDERFTKYMKPVYEYCVKFINLKFLGIIGLSKLDLKFVNCVMVFRKV